MMVIANRETLGISSASKSGRREREYEGKILREEMEIGKRER